MWELTKSFRFEAAHTLRRTTVASASEKVHGHFFRAEVAIRGVPDAQTGMIIDLGVFDKSLADVRGLLDHKLLNRVEAFGEPTLEDLSRFIFNRLKDFVPISRVSVCDSCNEVCSYFGGSPTPRSSRQRASALRSSARSCQHP